MRKFIILLPLLSFLAFHAIGQNQADILKVDTVTYALWQKGDWKNLINVGKQALNSSIDFYYLRVRMGIAYYETENYHAAIYHLEKAYQINQQESYLKEYLYYSYLFAGRSMESRIIYSTADTLLKKRIGYKKKTYIDGISLQYGHRLMADDKAIENFPADYTAPNDGFQEITKSLNTLSIGLRHDIFPKFSLNHAYTNIQKESFKHLIVNGTIEEIDNSKTSINQYYISGNSRVGENLNLLYGIHIINVRYPVEIPYFSQGNVFTATETISQTDLVGFMSFYKDLKYFTLGVSASFANLNSVIQTQGDLSLALYPLGNLNLYAVSTASFQRELYSNNTHNDELIYNQLIGFKTLKFLWLEGHITFGNLSNFVANDGASVFNGIGTIKQSFGSRAILLISPKLNFKISYTYSQIESSFIESLNVAKKHNHIKYKNHSITGGLVWNL
ncbi:MAG: hypothetical protein PHE03_07760 [Bacteroidales bacterium]|nr:hypothetical protein [Bacteroidales bacterium]MDD3892183.1 hypothetical protein [Bacteroidales bacterium]